MSPCFDNFERAIKSELRKWKQQDPRSINLDTFSFDLEAENRPRAFHALKIRPQ